MIDLTPLDVRNRRGDFKKLMRGYDPQEVDVFLELIAERLEALVRENLSLKERTQMLQEQVSSQAERERAVQDALVTAQELRADIREQSRRESETIIKEAETEARRIIVEAEAEARTKLRNSERQIDQATDSLVEMERRRIRFLKEYRLLLEREFDVVEVEESRTPLERRAIDLDLGPRRRTEPATRDRRNESVPLDEDLAPPPADVPIDELAARHAAALTSDDDADNVPEEIAALFEPGKPDRSAPLREENLLLYLDDDDDDNG
jgi:DivIVA domain-containing protein